VIRPSNPEPELEFGKDCPKINQCFYKNIYYPRLKITVEASKTSPLFGDGLPITDGKADGII